jgi:hypothetical protein
MWFISDEEIFYLVFFFGVKGLKWLGRKNRGLWEVGRKLISVEKIKIL